MVGLDVSHRGQHVIKEVEVGVRIHGPRQGHARTLTACHTEGKGGDTTESVTMVAHKYRADEHPSNLCVWLYLTG